MSRIETSNWTSCLFFSVYAEGVIVPILIGIKGEKSVPIFYRDSSYPEKIGTGCGGECGEFKRGKKKGILTKLFLESLVVDFSRLYFPR